MMRQGHEYAAVARWLALLLLLFGLAGLTFDTPIASSTMAAAKENGQGKVKAGRHDDDGDDDDDDSNKGPGNGGANREKAKKGKKHKKDDEERAPEPVQVVVVEAATEYRITVGCHTDREQGVSTCVFAGVATTEGQAIGGLAVPEGTVCASVVAGDFTHSDGGSADESVMLSNEATDAGWYAEGSGYRGPAYVSNRQPDVLTLVLTGTVTTSGTTTYWLRTENGVAAAAGPGLHCAATETTATGATNAPTGAIVVQGFACPFATAPTGSASVDWFAMCDQAAARATFELTALDGDNAGWQRTETADANGVLRAEGLAPGHYRLAQVNSDWCHAESDRVDDQGNLVVHPGERSSVWIFDCAETAKASPTPASK